MAEVGEVHGSEDVFAGVGPGDAAVGESCSGFDRAAGTGVAVYFLPIGDLRSVGGSTAGADLKGVIAGIAAMRKDGVAVLVIALTFMLLQPPSCGPGCALRIRDGSSGNRDLEDIETVIGASVTAIAGLEDVADLVLVILLEVESAAATAGAVASA